MGVISSNRQSVVGSLALLILGGLSYLWFPMPAAAPTTNQLEESSAALLMALADANLADKSLAATTAPQPLPERIAASEQSWKRVQETCDSIKASSQPTKSDDATPSLAVVCEERLGAHSRVIAAAQAYAEETSNFAHLKLMESILAADDAEQRVHSAAIAGTRARIVEESTRAQSLEHTIAHGRLYVLATTALTLVAFLPLSVWLRPGVQVAIVALAMASASFSTPTFANEPTTATVTPASVLENLKTANARFVSGKPKHPNQSRARVQELTKGQHPQAIILSCSDSRVPPELLFDSGLGDLFVIRSAGHTVDDMALASIEYAVEHLGANLIVVMGHTACGAVKATLGTPADKSAGSSNLDALVAQIRANLTKRQETSSSDPLVVSPVRANVDGTAESLLARSKILREKRHEGKIDIVSAIYKLDGGVVEFWPAPEGASLLAH